MSDWMDSLRKLANTGPHEKKVPSKEISVEDIKGHIVIQCEKCKGPIHVGDKSIALAHKENDKNVLFIFKCRGCGRKQGLSSSLIIQAYEARNNQPEGQQYPIVGEGIGDQDILNEVEEIAKKNLAKIVDPAELKNAADSLLTTLEDRAAESDIPPSVN